MRQMLPNMMNQISEGRVRQGAEGLVYRPTFAQENVLQDTKKYFFSGFLKQFARSTHLVEELFHVRDEFDFELRGDDVPSGDQHLLARVRNFGRAARQ